MVIFYRKKRFYVVKNHYFFVFSVIFQLLM